MKLSDYKDANGISLQTYADSLVEKLATHTNLTGFIILCDLEKAKKGENEGIHVISVMGEGSMFIRAPEILRELARQMTRSPFKFEGITKLHEEE